MKSGPIELKGKNGRVAIVSAVRTPFARIATHFADKNPIELGAMVVSELLSRSGLKPEEIEQCVFGQTIIMPDAPFIAREIVLATGMSPYTDAYSITRACATSFQTAATAANSIVVGEADIVVAGGVDSASSVRIPLSEKLSATLRDVNFAKTTGQRLKLLSKLRPKDIIPTAPSITEYSTGKTMGQSAEAMAKTWGVTREEQDDIAHASHSNAAQAWADGKMDTEVMTAAGVHEDNLIRMNSERAGYSKLKPVFDRENGTVTAGNASPLTDGASALLLMSENRAKELGFEPIAYIRSSAFAAKSPKEDLLMGPVLAVPTALDRAGVSLKDMDIVDMHEAFAAQIACNLRGLDSKKYMKEHLGRDDVVGEVDRSKLNLLGGSISYGHPLEQRELALSVRRLMS